MNGVAPNTNPDVLEDVVRNLHTFTLLKVCMH
jgi:hypothetical protein